MYLFDLLYLEILHLNLFMKFISSFLFFIIIRIFKFRFKIISFSNALSNSCRDKGVIL